jgi:hypothetical protein
VVGLETVGRSPGSPYYSIGKTMHTHLRAPDTQAQVQTHHVSIGYHGKTGKMFCDGKESEIAGTAFGEGGVVGIGINCSKREIFCSYNGMFLGNNLMLVLWFVLPVILSLLLNTARY